MKTSLGIWALGPMVTRFVPGGYQPQHMRETTATKVARAVEGLAGLIDDYEFHYPQELSEENLDDVRATLDGHGVYAIATGTAPQPAVRQEAGSRRRTTPSAPPRSTKRWSRRLCRGHRGADDPLAGNEGYNYPFQTPYGEAWARFVDGVGRLRRAARNEASRCFSSTRTPSRR